MTTKAPETIWLQLDLEDDQPLGDATWCLDQIEEYDTAYVRADLHTAVVAERDALLSALNQCRLAFAGYVSVQSAIDKIDALAKQEPKE